MIRTMLVAAVLAAPLLAEAQQKITIKKLAPLTLGLTGYSGAEGARSDSEQIQKYMAAKLNRELMTRVFADGDALAAAVASGQIDLAWLQPFAVIEATKKGKVEPLVKAVRHGLPFYRGVIFPRKDKPIPEGQMPKSISGMSIAWVSPTSAAGYLFPRAAIAQTHKGWPFFKKQEFLGDHAAVCRAVLDKKFDLGATFADDRPKGEQMQVDGCVQALGEEGKALNIVMTSAPIPNDAIVARPGLAADEVARIRKAFTGLASDPDGKVLLMAVFKAEGFEDVGTEDFEPVRFAAETASK